MKQQQSRPSIDLRIDTRGSSEVEQYSQLIFDKGAKAVQWVVSLTNARTAGQKKKKGLDKTFTFLTKINAK